MRALAMWAMMALAIATAALGAGNVPRDYGAHFTAKAPAIDGDLREEVWRAVPWAGDFTTLAGARAEPDTRFAMAWDANNLYVAVHCREPLAAQIQAASEPGDGRITNDDHIEVMLTAASERRTYLHILANPRRGLLDRTVEGGAAARGSLAASGLAAAGRVEDWEWRVEMAIPLPRAGIALREGEALAGNVCRVRTVGGVTQMTWAPLRGSFDRPLQFGTFTLLGPTPATATPAGEDTVLYGNGLSTSGRLTGFDTAGFHFISPKAAFVARPAEVKRVDLAWSDTDAIPAQLVLQNRGRIAGELLSLATEEAVIRSPAFGTLRVPRRLLARLYLGGQTIESAFDEGALKPWEPSVPNTTLVSTGVKLPPSRDASPSLILPLRQDRRVTLAAEMDLSPQSPRIEAALFAYEAITGVPHGLYLDLRTGAGMTLVSRGTLMARVLPRARTPLPAGPCRLLVTYDPADHTARAWLNKQPLVELESQEGPEDGTHIVIGSPGAMVRRLTVYSDLPAPADDHPALKAGGVLAYLANGDELGAREAVFDEGVFRFTTEFGEMTVPKARVRGIDFPAGSGAGETAPAWVRTAGSRLPLDLQSITAEDVRGGMKDVGEVTLKRSYVRSIAYTGRP